MKFVFLILFLGNLYSTPLTHKFALKAVEFAKPAESVPFTGFYRLKRQSDFFFKDLGAQFINEESSGFNGIYLSFAAVKQNGGQAFGKWRDLLKKPKNTKLLRLFEANLASANLNELFSFPRNVRFLKNAKNKTCIIFLDYSVPLTMQIREIMNFSLRGYNVLAVDFYTYNNGENFIPWDKCKKIANLAYDFAQGDILLYGKSFGSAPATYLASNHPSTPLILDRPFTSMNDVAGSYLLSSFIDLHYSYPTKELLSTLRMDPLIISSSDDSTFKNHGQELLETYIDSQINKDRDILKAKCFISTRGGHYSNLLNKGLSSWFSYEEAQRKLNQYLLSIESN